MHNIFKMLSVIMIMVIASVCSAQSKDGGVHLNEKSVVNIVIPVKPTRQITDTANILTKYISSSLGITATIRQSERSDAINIRIGDIVLLSNNMNELVPFESDAFVIDIVSSNNIIIAGRSDWGTEFGAYEFLQRYLGIMWLMPGTSGEYVPKHKEVIVPIQRVVMSPDIKSRALSGVPNTTQGTWARRNRNHGQVAFHHNLGNLFPPEKYVQSHPEFFPIVKGKRYLPKPNDKTMWQPCFSEPGLVDEAVKNIIDYFKSNPLSNSYSLGINDSQFFCECSKCSSINNEKNSLGYQNVSRSYFAWANAVVEKVLKVYPDKLFGCLAYHQLYEPASGVHVNPAIIPFLTSDRMKWLDPREKNDAIRITQSWKKHATRIGWYDYIYGSPYMMPRIYTNTMKDYISYASNNNIYAYYAEAYPNWGEGPKLYIFMKLLWDSKLDQNKLLEEWCVAAVGTKASKDLISYYRIWESIWTKSANIGWFNSNKREMLNFDRPEYLYIVNERDIEQLRGLITSVNANAVTPEQKERAKVLYRAFEYYEASILSYFNRNNTNDASKKNIYNEKRKSLFKEFESDILLVQPVPFSKWKTLNW